MMDPLVSAVMVLLSCSPDMLFCRRPPTEAPQPVYMTVSDCENALRRRLAEVTDAGKIVIGRCQAIGARSDAISWGISPNRELLTSVAPAEPLDVAAADSPAVDHDAPRHADAVPDRATVRVTRGMGPDAVTTSYVVKHAVQ
jgi:hypothetical protein